MRTLIRYVVLTALRDRLFVAVLAAALLAAVAASVLGGTALVEAEQTTQIYAAYAARLILSLGVIVFVCFHIRQAFDSKEIEVSLSRPLSRTALVIAYFLGFGVIASLLWLPVAGGIAWLGVFSREGFAAWSLSLWCELWIVAALALFAALMLNSSVSAVVAALGVYILSRMMGYFLATGAGNALFDSPQLNELLRAALQGVAVIVPRLDFFGKTEWLIYGVPAAQDWMLFLTQSAIFIPLLLLAAIVDFNRKAF